MQISSLGYTLQVKELISLMEMKFDCTLVIAKSYEKMHWYCARLSMLAAFGNRMLYEPSLRELLAVNRPKIVK